MKTGVIVLPTYNERDNLKTIIPEIFQKTSNISNWNIGILVVDDSSPDGTVVLLEELKKKYKKLHYITGKKEGLGKAYVRGFSHLLKSDTPDVIFEMDADWSHDPNAIPQFLKKIDEGADIVIGTRYIKGGSIPQDWEFHRKLFSFVGNLIVRVGFMHLSVHDWTNGYRAIKSTFLKEILDHLSNYNGYVFQIALLDKAVKNNLKISEIPIQFNERASGASKINSARYIYDIFSYIFIHSTFIKFAIVGAFGFLINIIGLEIFFQYGLTAGTAAAIGAELSIISNFILNNAWSFSHKKINTKHSLLSKFIQFNIVSAGSIVIQFIVVETGTYFFGVGTRFVFLFIAVVFFIIPYSYFMYNRFIWKSKN